tara:strand:- start:2907 stop:3368 length:462 start_codon:yes stop_codon:yes gene_type:complete
MPYKSTFTKKINKLKRWAKEKHSLTLVFDTGQADRYLPDDRIIVVNEGQTDEHKCYALLHELGHHRNRVPGTGDYHKRFRLLSDADKRGKPIRSYAYRVQIVEEEIQAWRNGEAIAKQLDLNIDSGKYHNYAAKWVMTYIDWASHRQWNQDTL